jgi:hypothetical protein
MKASTTKRRPRATRRPSESSLADWAASNTQLTFTVRKVAASGRIRWKSALVTIGHALEGESIGIEERDGMHHVFFAGVRLGFLDDERRAWTRSSTCHVLGKGEIREKAERAEMSPMSPDTCHPCARARVLPSRLGRG